MFRFSKENLQRRTPLCIQVTKPIADYGTAKGISAQEDHLEKRALCLSFFHAFYGSRDVLRYNDAVLARFQSIPFVKKDVALPGDQDPG